MDLCDPQLSYLSGVCFQSVRLSTNSQSQIYEVAIESLLPQHLIQLISLKDFDQTGPFIHNLDANPIQQSMSLDVKQIILTNGELFILSILHSLTKQQEIYIPSFYCENLILPPPRRQKRVELQSYFDERLDYQRIQIMIFTKILHYLLNQKELTTFRGSKATELSHLCDVMVLGVEEYILSPINQKYHEKISSTVFKRLHTMGDVSVQTIHLEALYVLITLTQRRCFLFENTSYMNSLQQAQLNRDRTSNYLLELKQPLYYFFKASFSFEIQLEHDSNGPFRGNGIADVGAVLFQMLQPWNAMNEFIADCCDYNLYANDQQANQENQPFTSLFDQRGDLNQQTFINLTTRSISSLKLQMSFSQEKFEDKVKIRKQWESYIHEFILFYTALIKDYLSALDFKGNYTIEDVTFFSQIINFFKFEKYDPSSNHQQSSRVVEPASVYTLAGLMSIEQFHSMVQSAYHQNEFNAFENKDMIIFFNDDYYEFLLNLNFKLSKYEVTNLTKQYEIKQINEIENQVSKMLFRTDEIILESRRLFQEYMNNRDRMEISYSEQNSRRNLPIQTFIRDKTDITQVSYSKFMRPQRFEEMKSPFEFERRHKTQMFEKHHESGTQKNLFQAQQQEESKSFGKSPSFQHAKSQFSPERSNPAQTSLRYRQSQTQDNFENLMMESRNQKQKISQPRQKVSLSKRKLENQLEKNAFEGSEWNRRVSCDEWQILFIFMRILAFIIDKLRNQKPDENGNPITQWPRIFAQPRNFFQLILYTSLLFVIIRYFLLI